MRSRTSCSSPVEAGETPNTDPGTGAESNVTGSHPSSTDELKYKPAIAVPPSVAVLRNRAYTRGESPPVESTYTVVKLKSGSVSEGRLCAGLLTSLLRFFQFPGSVGSVACHRPDPVTPAK